MAQSALLFEEKEKRWFDSNMQQQCRCTVRLWPWKSVSTLCTSLIHENKGLTLKANNKSQLSPSRPLLSGYSRIVLIAVCCLRLSDAEFVAGQGDRQVEGCDSHLLIVTGRGWTPARKEAIISLSSTARCYYCQNFNRATKSILQGQIKKSLSKPWHTEESVLVYLMY